MKPVTYPTWLLRRVTGFALSLGALGAVTIGLAPLVGDEQLLAVALLYLLLTLLSAALWGYLAGLATAFLANLLLNFFFVPPIHNLSVQRPENIAALVVFLTVAATGASMLAMLRRQVAEALARRTETAILLDVSQAIVHAATPREAVTALCETIARALRVEACAILERDADHGEWAVVAATTNAADRARLAPAELAAANAALERATPTHLEDSARTFVPFSPATQRDGVLRLIGRIEVPRGIDQTRLLRTFADEASVALHRAQLADDAQRAEALQRNDEFKSTLLSSVSHDLRSPLTAIKVAVGSLRDGAVEWSPEDEQRFLETIEAQTDRLTTVVTDLLEMSRLEGGATRLELEPVQVSLLLRDIAQATSVATEGRSVTIEARDHLWVRADYALLMQALGNLVENAARYSVPRGTIRLSAEAAGGEVVLRVADAGPGIPPEDQPHVFEKFYRGAQERRSKGTGLGLAITKAMVELCGGAIRLESSFRGTVFAVTLPAIPDPAHPTLAQPTSALSTPAEPPTTADAAAERPR